ncbi:MAG: metallophosphoesterase [Methylococcales bacterium]|nr:metallophosphoesterase [Methylococcales bacterium]
MKLRLLHLTDIHFPNTPGELLYGVDTEQTCQAVLTQAFIHHGGFDLLLITGDLAADPKSPEVYRRLAACLAVYGVDTVALPGNHDHYPWLATHFHCPSVVNLPGWQVLCLNSQIPGEPGGALSEMELAWLEQQLAEPLDGYRLLCLHHSPLPLGSAWLDTMTLTNGEALLALAQRSASVRALLHGHVHQAAEHSVDGVSVIATPSTCAQFLPGSETFALDDKPPAYRIIELGPAGQIHSQLYWLDSGRVFNKA